MNNTCKRFLALNCVLQGHELSEIFVDSSEFASCLETTEEKALQLWNNLQELSKFEDVTAKCNPVVLALLNFFRCEEYSYIFIPNNGPFTFRAIMESDLRGGIEPAVRVAALRQVIRDVEFVTRTRDIKVADGVLYFFEEDKDKMQDFLLEAYTLYRDGPVKKSYLNGHKNLVVLRNYKGMSGRTLVSVFSEMIDQKINPTSYSKTNLIIPDYVEVYKSTGCIMETSDEDKSVVNWLLDDVSGDKCKVLSVNFQALRELIFNSLHDLESVKYKAGAPNGGLYIGE